MSQSGEIRAEFIGIRVSLVAQTVKNLPAMQETQVRSLGQEDPLEEDMATQSSIRAWRIPMERGAWRVTAHGVANRHSEHTRQYQITSTYVSLPHCFQ